MVYDSPLSLWPDWFKVNICRVSVVKMLSVCCVLSDSTQL